MTRPPPSARTTNRRIRWLLVVGLIVVIAAITAALGYKSQKSSSSSAASPLSSSAASPSKAPRSEHRDALGEAGGVVADGVTVFDKTIPAVANLDPALIRALRQAATDAANDRVKFYVSSGWRSPEYQNQLLREAVSKYGSEDEAARWVATAVTSPHVSGDAVDIEHSDATAWLSKHGAGSGCARSTGTNPGTTNCAPMRSIVAARLCLPTPLMTRGCSSDRR